MRSRAEILRNPRVRNVRKSLWFDSCEVTTRSGVVDVLFADDEDGWEHVSVSPRGSKRERDKPCPTWVQMCEVKDVFWGKDEGVVQFHPPESHYLHGIGGDTNILHLWRPIDDDWSRISWKDE